MIMYNDVFQNVTLYWFHINYLTKLKCPENDIHTVELLLFFFFFADPTLTVSIHYITDILTRTRRSI